jgi:hypothetical protein
MGGGDNEVMFLTSGDLTGDGGFEVLAATKDNGFVLLQRAGGNPAADSWENTIVPIPEGCGTGKGVGIADIDGDGRPDIVFSCEHAGNKDGLMWLSPPEHGLEGPWQPHEVSGLEGIKYDLVQLQDFDADGDLDVLTCEERAGLGVVWYENPAR